MLVAALPELALNLLSAATTQTSIHFHYTAGLIPPLVVATVLGAARLGRRRPDLRAPLATARSSLRGRATTSLGAVPLWRYLPGGEQTEANAAQVTAHDRIAARRAAADPGGRRGQRDELARRAPLCAAPRPQLPVHPGRDLGRRRRDPARLRRPVAPLPTAVSLARLRRNPDWRLVFERDGVLVFRRRG